MINRDELGRRAMSALAEFDDTTASFERRRQARLRFDAVSEVLLYQEPDLVMVPATFYVNGYFTRKVERIVSQLDPVVAQQNPAYIAIARTLAGEIDNRCYATQFRKELLVELNSVLDVLADAEVWAGV